MNLRRKAPCPNHGHVGGPSPGFNQTNGRFVAFREGGDLLVYLIFDDGKILGLKTRNVVSLLVGHGYVELDEVYDDVEIGAFLSFNPCSVARRTEPKTNRTRYDRVFPYHDS